MLEGDMEIFSMLLLQSPSDEDKKRPIARGNWDVGLVAFGMSEVPLHLPLFQQGGGWQSSEMNGVFGTGRKKPISA